MANQAATSFLGKGRAICQRETLWFPAGLAQSCCPLVRSPGVFVWGQSGLLPLTPKRHRQLPRLIRLDHELLVLPHHVQEPVVRLTSL